MICPPALLEIACDAGAAAKKRGVLLSAAESCTGGLIAAALTHFPGSSEWFCRGIVSYSNAAKMDLLNVPEKTLRQFGAVSEETAAAMCIGIGDFSLAVSGVAGPAASENKPAGMVCFGFRCGGEVRTETRHFAGDRDSVRLAAACHSLQTITKMLRQI